MTRRDQQLASNTIWSYSLEEAQRAALVVATFDHALEDGPRLALLVHGIEQSLFELVGPRHQIGEGMRAVDQHRDAPADLCPPLLVILRGAHHLLLRLGQRSHAACRRSWAGE